MAQESPIQDTSHDTSARMTRIKPHRKSRHGCINCKRRRVKCDEEKPACANCIHFGLPCEYAPAQLPSGSSSVDGDGVERLFHPRRGRGRPRKDWASPPTAPEITDSSSMSTSSTALSPAASDSQPGHCALNVVDVELLLHFSSTTARSLAGSDKDDNAIVKFWAHNVPQLGLSHHFVLHLAFAVAGSHLAHLRAGEGRRQRYVDLAERHLSAGLAEFTKALPNLDDSNCGALYVSAILVCYCTFAAGPTSPDDLLLCNVNNENPVRWLPLIHGVRLIRTTVDPAILFSGLMAPLGPSDEPLPASGPVFAREGFVRIDWEKPLYELRSYVASCNGLDVDVCLRSFDALSPIYEAIYGKANGSYDGPPENEFIFGWLYRLEDSFVACLRRKEPLALLILAYAALLFRTMDKCWFMDGWSHHILTRIRDSIGEGYVVWLRWPMEQAGLEWGSDHIF